MPENLTPKSFPVNLIESVCDRCRRVRSRRGALVARVGNREKFICRECADSFAEYFQPSRDERVEVYEMLSGLGGVA